MKNTLKKMIVSLSPAILIALATTVVAPAEETVGEKATAAGRDTQLGAKKGWNKTKKTARKMTGNTNRKKDVAEKTDEMTDAAGNQIKETKNQID